MRYQIMVFPQPTDPRDIDHSSADILRSQAPIVAEYPSEEMVAMEARHRWPDAAAMVIPLEIGTGETRVIGLVADAHAAVGEQTKIPCTAIVYAAPDTDADRQRIKRRVAFNRGLWKMPVTRPEFAAIHRVEIRATDLEVPSFTEARVGYYEGRLVIYAELGGIELSIRFDDPAVQLSVSGAPATVAADGRDVSGALDRIAGV